MRDEGQALEQKGSVASIGRETCAKRKGGRLDSILVLDQARKKKTCFRRFKTTAGRRFPV